jgi:hypothetical protein
MAEVFIVKNTTASPIEIRDFGIVVGPGILADLGNLDRAILSVELAALLISGALVRCVDGVEMSVERAHSPALGYLTAGAVPLSRLMSYLVSSGTEDPTGTVFVTKRDPMLHPLDVSVAAGFGYIQNTVSGVLSAVAWDAGDLSISDDSSEYVYFKGATETLGHGVSLPDDLGNIVLARVVTKGGAIRWIHDAARTMTYPGFNIFNYAKSIHKILTNTGLVISEGTAKKLDIGQGSYWVGTILIARASANDVAFDYYWNNGANENLAQDTIDDVRYDNAGVLTAMTSDSYHKADTIYMTSDGVLSVMYGTTEYATEAEALAESRTPAFTALLDTAIPLAKIIIRKNNGIVTFQDLRPFVQYGTAAQAGGAPASHSSLSDLDHDDHTQYLLVTGTREMGGDLDMGSNDIVDVGNVDGVDVSGHAARHLPGALDGLTTGVPVSIGAANAEGGGAAFSRSDHCHTGDGRYVRGPGASVDGEVALFNGAGGATIKRADQTGLLKATAGVLAVAVSGVDYLGPIGRTSNLLAAPVAMTNANQFYAGPTLAALPAGTYFITGAVLVKSPDNVNVRITSKLWNGGATVWASTEAGRTVIGFGNPALVGEVLCAILTLASPTTISISAAATIAGCSIESTPYDNAGGCGNTASYLNALKLV